MRLRPPEQDHLMVPNEQLIPISGRLFQVLNFKGHILAAMGTY